MGQRLIKNRPPVAGDRIKFSSPTVGGAPTATRKVKAVNPDGSVEVVFHGWSNFIVWPGEIHGIVEEA